MILGLCLGFVTIVLFVMFLISAPCNTSNCGCSSSSKSSSLSSGAALRQEAAVTPPAPFRPVEQARPRLRKSAAPAPSGRQEHTESRADATEAQNAEGDGTRLLRGRAPPNIALTVNLDREEERGEAFVSGRAGKEDEELQRVQRLVSLKRRVNEGDAKAAAELDQLLLRLPGAGMVSGGVADEAGGSTEDTEVVVEADSDMQVADLVLTEEEERLAKQATDVLGRLGSGFQASDEAVQARKQRTQQLLALAREYPEARDEILEVVGADTVSFPTYNQMKSAKARLRQRAAVPPEVDATPAEELAKKKRRIVDPSVFRGVPMPPELELALDSQDA